MKKYLLLTLLCVSMMATAAIRPVVVEIETNMGIIEVELDRQKAPLTVMNFLKYVDSGFYEGTIFHRVVRDYVIQGGGFNRDLEKKKTTFPVKNEANNGLSNLSGTISMARMNKVDSATSQFFFNIGDNAHLDFKGKYLGGEGYAVFGKISKGLGIIQRMETVNVGVEHGRKYVPVEDIYIRKMRRKL